MKKVHNELRFVRKDANPEITDKLKLLFEEFDKKENEKA